MSMGYQNGGKTQPNAQAGADNADWDTLKEDVGEIAGAAVERGRHFVDAARDQAVGYVDRRKDDLAQSVADFANTLRESTRSFEDKPNIHAFVDGAVEGLEELAETIRGRSFAEIFNQVEDVMRRRPTAVAAVTLTAGFMVARFIKASAHEARQSANRGGMNRAGSRGGQARSGQGGASRSNQASRSDAGAASRSGT
jgi:hypothetical protein